MTDRELLELAAKAAGMNEKWRGDGIYVREQFCEVPWNPLTGDGDALRLASQLFLCIEHGYCADDAPVVRCGRLEDREEWPMVPAFPDRGASVRRVIVEAAAEIGRLIDCNCADQTECDGRCTRGSK